MPNASSSQQRTRVRYSIISLIFIVTSINYADRATILENGVAVLSGKARELRERDDIKSFYLGKKAAAPINPALAS